LSGDEVTQSIIAILQDVYENCGVLQDARQLKIQAQYAPLVREIDFSKIEITIFAFGRLFNFDSMHRYFCEGISRYFPECKRLILPSTIHCSFQTPKNVFCTHDIVWVRALVEKYTSPWPLKPIEGRSAMQIELCMVLQRIKTTSCTFNLANFFTPSNQVNAVQLLATHRHS
jgi:hypothetical protein